MSTYNKCFHEKLTIENIIFIWSYLQLCVPLELSPQGN